VDGVLPFRQEPPRDVQVLAQSVALFVRRVQGLGFLLHLLDFVFEEPQSGLFLSGVDPARRRRRRMLRRGRSACQSRRGPPPFGEPCASGLALLADLCEVCPVRRRLPEGVALRRGGARTRLGRPVRLLGMGRSDAAWRCRPSSRRRTIRRRSGRRARRCCSRRRQADGGARSRLGCPSSPGRLSDRLRSAVRAP
jgi:hypothetical protein